MKTKIPASLVSVFSREQDAKQKSDLIKQYKDWQESRFSKAHYEYLCKEHDKLINEYINMSWTTKFLRSVFLTENKAKLEVIKKLKETFRCETI
jgi:hypothetical protein